jgi:hypothetical protein
MARNRRAFLLGMLVVAVGLWAGRQWAQAQAPQRAAVVVRLDEGRVESRCVAFEEASISGYDLLLRSGLAVDAQVASIGTMVCAVAGTGCPVNDCLCQCQGGENCVYWSYWHLTDGRWQYARAGAGSYRISDGMVDGWVWGPGSVSSAPPPPEITFAEVCADDQTPPVAGDQPAAPPRSGAGWNYLIFGLIVAAMAMAWFLRQVRTEGDG